MRKTHSLALYWMIGVLILSILFILSSVLFDVFQLDILPAQFFGALIGVVITAIITVFLLKGQSENEEKRELGLKMFEKKQEIYHNFLEKLKEVIHDGKITNALSANEPDELQELLFQMGYLRMHTDKQTTQQIFLHISDIISELNEFQNLQSDEEKAKAIDSYYISISTNLFAIIKLLRNELYLKEDSNSHDEALLNDSIETLLERSIPDYNQTHEIFFEGLIARLVKANYSVVINANLKGDITKYNDASRSSEVKGFDVKFNNTKLTFAIERNYYWGIKTNETDIPRDKMASILPEMTENWIGYKYAPKEIEINFWQANSPNYSTLRSRKKRDELLDKIANAIKKDIDALSELRV